MVVWALLLAPKAQLVPKALMVLLDEALGYRHQMVVLALLLAPKALMVLLDEALGCRHQ